MFPTAAVITGGARGLGRAFAEALLRNGTKVVIADVNQALGKETAQQFSRDFPKTTSLFVQCDVSKDTDVKGLVDTARREFGQIDLFVNNAGIQSETQWTKMVDINLKGVVGGTLAAVDVMGKEQGGVGGQIINVGSTAGIIPMFFSPVYSAVKFGVIGFTRSMAAGYRDNVGIRFNCLCPSFTRTELVEEAEILGDRDAARQIIENTQLMEVSQVVDAFLQLVRSTEYNGAVLAVSPKGVKVKYDIGLKSKL